MAMFISSITDISSFSDPKVYFWQAPFCRKVLRETFEVLKTAFQMCMRFLFNSMGQSNSIFKIMLNKTCKLRAQHRTKEANIQAEESIQVAGK